MKAPIGGQLNPFVDLRINGEEGRAAQHQLDFVGVSYQGAQPPALAPLNPNNRAEDQRIARFIESKITRECKMAQIRQGVNILRQFG